jgi:hypothetical protein
MTGIERIAAERERQLAKEGWTPEHDDSHTSKELARAAGCYVLDYTQRGNLGYAWPWWDKERMNAQFWKPTPSDPIRQLEKAGALIAAEIDRLLRVSGKEPVKP